MTLTIVVFVVFLRSQTMVIKDFDTLEILDLDPSLRSTMF